MPKMKLDNTSALLARCEDDKKKTDYWDTIVNGFVLECRASGGKTYYLRYFDANGRQRQHKIGRYEDLTFDRARKEAKRLRSEVVLGGDPMARKEERKAVPTYAEVAERHLSFAATYQRSFETTEGYMRKHVIPRWGKVRLTDIQQSDVANWLAEKSETLKPATVEKIRVIFSRSFELANQWAVPGGDKNPVRGVPRRAFSNARDRFLTAEEAERLSKAVAASRNTQLKYVVGLLLLTGARRSELLNARWQDVDLDRRMWLIPLSKTGKARHVPLSQAAVDLIAALPRFKNCAYLLPNPDTWKPFTSIKHSWQTARAAAGLGDVRIHDLRHSAASFMINAGIDLYTVGAVLGHKSHISTARYSHVANGTLLAAVEAGAGKLQLDWSKASTGGQERVAA